MNSIKPFLSRNVPWSGLGTDISDCTGIDSALKKAGLDWDVRQAPVQSFEPFPTIADGYKMNIRNDNGMPLGIVKERYRVVQNLDAFAFMDSLVQEGVSFIQAGQFQGGRKVWLLARLPDPYTVVGDDVQPYIIFINSHDGTTGIKAAMTPIRVICCNMLNLALYRASRSWSSVHAGDISKKLEDAKDTLLNAKAYMNTLSNELESLYNIRIPSSGIEGLTNSLLPVDDSMSDLQKRNVITQREGLLQRYFLAPDLQGIPDNAYRFINAVSDFVTHSEPLRKTRNYNESLFTKTIEGHVLIDKAYRIVAEAV